MYIYHVSNSPFLLFAILKVFRQTNLLLDKLIDSCMIPGFSLHLTGSSLHREIRENRENGNKKIHVWEKREFGSFAKRQRKHSSVYEKSSDIRTCPMFWTLCPMYLTKTSDIMSEENIKIMS